MPGHSRSKNGVASLAYAPGIPTFETPRPRIEMARTNPGHDELLGHEFRPRLVGVLAERRYRTVAARRRRVHFRRRRIRDRAVWRADRNAAQMRMMRELGGRVDLRKGDVGGGELLRDLRGVERGEFGGDFSVSFGAPFHAFDVGGEGR